MLAHNRLMQEQTGFASGKESSSAIREVAIALKHCSLSFGSTRVLNDVSIDIFKGEFVSILGPSGCGKSTTLRLMLGLLKPDEGGSVAFASDSPNIGMVFQKPVLMPWLNAVQNIELSLRLKDKKKYSKQERRDKAENALRLVGLQDFRNHYPQQLSGGMQQRISIARALAADPEMLLMDEPFGALDELTREKLNFELLRLWESADNGLSTIVMVTHSIQESVMLSDRVVMMSPRPAGVEEIITVPLPRPREVGMEEHPGYFRTVKELRKRVKDQ